MNNKLIKLLLFFIIFICTYNVNVYADDNECLYYDIFKVKYDSANDNLTYEEVKDLTECGTEGKPCKNINQIYYSKTSAFSDGTNGTLKKEWKNIFIKNGKLTCPSIYYYRSKSNSPINDSVMYQFEFSPVKEPSGFGSRKFNAMIDSQNTIVSTCGTVKIYTFESSYNGLLSGFEKQINIYITEIQKYNNTDYDNLNELAKQYTQKIKEDVDNKTTQLIKIYDQLQCNYTHTYDYIYNYEFVPSINNIQSKFFLALDEIVGINYSNNNMSQQDYEKFHQSAYDRVVSASNSDKDPAAVNEFESIIIDWADPVSVNCDGIIGKDLLDFFNKIFKWIRIIAPIAVIVLGSVDFAGAVLHDDKDAMKKATSKFIKRLIVAAALFFIPLILEFILNIFNQITGSHSSICDIGR